MKQRGLPTVLTGGKIMRSDMAGLTFYHNGDPVRILPGSFVSDEMITRFGIDSKYFVHPDSLRAKGSFDFAAEHKGNFSVGIRRIQFGRGDVLLASVIAKALKKKYGKRVKIYYLVRPGYEDLLKHNPYVTQVFTSEQAYNGAGIDIQFGVDDLEFKVELKEFESKNKITRNRTTIYLEQLGLYVENKTPVYIVTDEEKKWAKKELTKLSYKLDKPIIGIQLYGSNVSRTYPKMRQFAEDFKKRGHQIFYLDAKKKDGNFKYGLRQTAALVNEMYLSITPNSFFFHLAGAMKKRAIALFGSCDGFVWTEDYEKVTPLQVVCPKGEPRCWWKIKCVPGGNLREKEITAAPPCLKKITFPMIRKEIAKHYRAKKILIVILTYDSLGLTQQMVESIRSFHNYDILVIDNESHDGTQDWLERKGIEFISEKMSVPQAWNLGMRTAYERGYDYALLCNNDIILAPNYIDKVIEVAERRKAFAVTGKVINKGEAPQQRFAEIVKNLEVPVQAMEAGDYSALLLSDKCIRRIGKFNERFYPRYQSDEDHLLRLRLSGKGLIKTFSTTFFHLLGSVIDTIPKERKKHEADWDRNTKLFQKIWKIHPYDERGSLGDIGLIKRRNPAWAEKICIPFVKLGRKKNGKK